MIKFDMFDAIELVQNELGSNCTLSISPIKTGYAVVITAFSDDETWSNIAPITQEEIDMGYDFFLRKFKQNIKSLRKELNEWENLGK